MVTCYYKQSISNMPDPFMYYFFMRPTDDKTEEFTNVK